MWHLQGTLYSRSVQPVEVGDVLQTAWASGHQCYCELIQWKHLQVSEFLHAPRTPLHVVRVYTLFLVSSSLLVSALAYNLVLSAAVSVIPSVWDIQTPFTCSQLSIKPTVLYLYRAYQ